MKFLSGSTALVSLATLALSVPNPLPGSDDIEVRDPAIWYNPDSRRYFAFSTGDNIRIFTSDALTGPWTRNGSVLPNCSVIQKPGRCVLWAPDVHFVNGRYVLYYSVSTSGSQDSAIGVAASPSMENGTWEDLGRVLDSREGLRYNAIDANIIDADGLKMTFGSWNDGLFQLPLQDERKLASDPPGAHLAGGNEQPTEGGFIYKPQGSPFFYQFFSNGHTPTVNDPNPRPPAGDEYKVLVGRSESVSGPYVDRDGHALTEVRDPPTGTLVLGSHDDVYAPGGQSVFRDPVSGRDVMVYHYVNGTEEVGGPSYLGINFLDFASGWPVVVE